MKRPRPHSGYLLRIAVVSVLVAAAGATHAIELWHNDETGRDLTLSISPKLTTLLSRLPDDRRIFPDNDSAIGLGRVRFGLKSTLNDDLEGEFAYEHRLQWSDEGTAGVGALLSDLTRAPYRLGQLDWQVTANNRHSWRHEIDRALLAWHPDWGEVTLGRQGIGLGRGVLFGAVDMFSPFSPLEVDREWRRGVDALRVEYRSGLTSSMEFIAVGGKSWDDSALLGRIRGYMGNIDGELIVGKRAKDLMLGGVMSGIVKDAAVHGELALFHTDEKQRDGGFFGEDRLVAKAVIGSSYTFDVGKGLTVLGEYHYSGFGVKDLEDVRCRLFWDQIFTGRYMRGDMQILGRHAMALQMTYNFDEAWTGSLLLLASPKDGSGVAMPSFTWNFSRHGALRTSLYLPWGDRPSRGLLRSEFGATPWTLFTQVALYF